MLIADASNDATVSLFSRIVEDSGIAHVLRMVRKHLGMDVAFELRQLIPDTSRLPEALALPATRAIPIGSHLSVPIKLDSGEVYGTLCCSSDLPDVTLGDRDMGMMRAFAEVLAARIDEDLARVRARERTVEDIRSVMAAGAPRIVFQPIYRLEDEEVAAVECLARFDREPVRPPDHWFNAAHEVGVGLDLELHAVQNALTALDRFPHPVSLGINSSAELILSGRLASLLGEVDLGRVIIEITEHTTVTDYDALARALRPMRDLGVGLAIDDAGAGYASMRHILNLKSDVIKLDMSLTRDIDSDASRRALARGLISFAHDIGSSITAEGVETRGELEVLRSLGVDKVQGYFLSRPLPLEAALDATQSGCPAFGAAHGRVSLGV